MPPLIAPLLLDETVALLRIPYQFGEIRGIAAQALRQTLLALGDPTPVEIAALPKPLDANELGLLAEAHGVPTVGGADDDPHAGMIAVYGALRDRGVIPIWTIRDGRWRRCGDDDRHDL